MQRVWKPQLLLGFILLGFLGGCGEPPPDASTLLQRSEKLLAAGQIESALLLLEQAHEVAPERADVLETLADAYAANGDPVLASMTFLELAELVPERPEYLLFSAHSLIEAGDRRGAVDRYQRYLGIRPEDRAVWVALSGLYEEMGQLGEALEALLAAERAGPRPAQRIDIGRLFLQSGNLAQAQVWFAQALEDGSDYRDEALLGLLETAVRSRRYLDAEQLLSQLDREYPGRLERSPLDDVRDQLQEWRQRQDEARQAVAALEGPTREEAAARESVEPDPSAETAAAPATPQPAPAPAPARPPAADRVAVEPAVNEQVVEKIPAESPPLPSAPEAVSPVLQQARESRAAGDRLAAIELYKKALVEDDTQAAVWGELSAVTFEAGNFRWAQATASEAMRRDPDNPRYVLQFLRAAQRTLSADRVIREMEDAYRRFPNQPEIILVLARAYEEADNRRNAWMLFRKFLQVAPTDHPERPAAQQSMNRLSGP